MTYYSISPISYSFNALNLRVAPKPYTTNASNASAFARQAAPMSQPGQSYHSYFASHALYTNRGFDPQGQLTRIANGGGLQATQAVPSQQATQATQARQYVQPAFRRYG